MLLSFTKVARRMRADGGDDSHAGAVGGSDACLCVATMPTQIRSKINATRRSRNNQILKDHTDP